MRSALPGLIWTYSRMVRPIRVVITRSDIERQLRPATVQKTPDDPCRFSMIAHNHRVVMDVAASAEGDNCDRRTHSDDQSEE